MRVPDSIDVQYKFLSKYKSFQCEEVFSGKLVDVRREQAVISGALPDDTWREHILAGRILLGLNIFLPTESVPIKILTTVTDVRGGVTDAASTSGGADEDRFLVLNFREISEDHHRRILKFIVSLYLRKPSP